MAHEMALELAIHQPVIATSAFYPSSGNRFSTIDILPAEL
jgi:hypothetical protein